jgi:hypothetical protein
VRPEDYYKRAQQDASSHEEKKTVDALTFACWQMHIWHDDLSFLEKKEDKAI